MGRRQLKVVAAIAMVLDHIAVMRINSPTLVFICFRIIGRVAAPLMCFFLVEGFSYTHDLKEYKKRLLLGAIVSQFPYMLAFKEESFLLSGNILFTLWMSLCLLEKVSSTGVTQNKKMILGVLAICLCCDGGLLIPIWTYLFWKYPKRDKIFLRWYLSTVVLEVIFRGIIGEYGGGRWSMGLIYLGQLGAIALLQGQKRKKEECSRILNYFYYTFYPAHLVVLWLWGKIWG